MKKLLFSILILLLLNIISFNYLKQISSDRNPYTFISDSNPIILPKKDILLDNIDEFKIEDYFKIYSLNDYKLDHKISDSTIDIILNNKEYSFPYSIRQPEIVEVIVYQKVESNKPLNNVHIDNTLTNVDTDISQNIKPDNIPDTINTNNHPSSNFTLNRSSLSYPIDTDLNRIISDIYSSFISNVAVSIDYSMLNPGAIGSYEIYLNHEGINDVMVVSIF